ncbi:hypothetical protein [Photorhabdus luminescens]|uniref:hypothetical protein n=1 Tax=Photorhabdus luminescens TaxID=29488 RepID=UPI0030D85A97
MTVRIITRKMPCYSKSKMSPFGTNPSFYIYAGGYAAFTTSGGMTEHGLRKSFTLIFSK